MFFTPKIILFAPPPNIGNRFDTSAFLSVNAYKITSRESIDTRHTEQNFVTVSMPLYAVTSIVTTINAIT